MTTHTRPDITDRRDITRLVDVFYDRIRADAVLGPIFDDVAHVDWTTHLPRMYDFWEAVLFNTPTFKGDPLVVHRLLGKQAPLTRVEFDRWIALFLVTVEDLFAGTIAEKAKGSALRIAAVLEHGVAINSREDSPARSGRFRLASPLEHA